MQVTENLDARQIWFDLAPDSVTRAMPIQGKGVKAGALITFQVSDQPPLVGAPPAGDNNEDSDGDQSPPPPDSVEEPGQQGAEA